MINDNQTSQILQAVAERRLEPSEGVAQLHAGGFDLDDAHEAVFVALGGSDLVETGPDGRERYVPSGKLVSEVLAEMGD